MASAMGGGYPGFLLLTPELPRDVLALKEGKCQIRFRLMHLRAELKWLFAPLIAPSALPTTETSPFDVQVERYLVQVSAESP
jgi:hypothetical protein